MKGPYSAGELALMAQLDSKLKRWCVREYRFAPPRRWRFDFAWPEYRIAVEVEGAGPGGVGRHGRVSGMARDCEKYAEAVCRGWRVLRGTTEQAENGQLLGWLQRLVK